MNPKATSGKRRGLARVGVWSVWACRLAVVVGTACGSDDSSRQVRREPPSEAGAGGEPDLVGAGGGQVTDAGGTGGNAAAGMANGGEPALAGAGGSASPGAAGASGAAGAAGAAPEDCESVAPADLAGTWRTNCHGYQCTVYIAASGKVAGGCTNGQYESGTIDEDGAMNTTGEGGAFNPYSTKGTLARDACDLVTRNYVGQIPPLTGPEQSYTCQMTRIPACAPTLLETLVGVWNGNCGSSTCETTFTATGEMSSTCSNGQSSTGSIDETGAFSDSGSGGNFPAYSTAGVIALDGCDEFLMPYTWQSPPNTGKKTSSQCSYTRKVE